MHGDEQNYNKNSINAQLAIIITKLEAQDKASEVFRTELIERVAKSEQAIAILMKWRYYIIGASAVIAYAANKLMSWFKPPNT